MESSEYLDTSKVNELTKKKHLSTSDNVSDVDHRRMDNSFNEQNENLPKSLQSPKRDKNIYFTHRIQYEHSPINTRPNRSKYSVNDSKVQQIKMKNITDR